MIDAKKVTSAVKIKLSLLSHPHGVAKVARLQKDLRRLKDLMTGEELNEYTKRII